MYVAWLTKPINVSQANQFKMSIKSRLNQNMLNSIFRRIGLKWL